jgi:hypothetical protein
MSSARDLAEALADCLSLLAEGRATLEDCLARYPEHAEELRRALAASQALGGARLVRPAPQFKAEARARLVAHMAAHPRRGKGRQAAGMGRWPVWRLAFALAALGVFVLTGGTALAQFALPGDALYSWKTASESAWRAFQPNPVAANLALTGRRAEELQQVAGDPIAEAIALRGYTQALERLAESASIETDKAVQEALVEQQEALGEAGVSVPELDALLAAVPDAPIALPSPEATAGGIIGTLPVPGLLPATETPNASSTETLPPAATALPQASPTPILPLPTLPVTLPAILP